MSHSVIVVGRLWSGPFQSLQELDDMSGLEVVVSILPIGSLPCDETAHTIRQRLSGRGLRHRILVTSDHDNSIPCEHIADVTRDPAPTLIHCNAGQNRSTMLAACWLLHRGTDDNAEDALYRVSSARESELGFPPKVYPSMAATVARFEGYLKALGCGYD